MTKYIFLGLLIILAVISGLFYFYYKSAEAEKATLVANQAKLELAVKTNEATIQTLQDSAKRQAQATVNLQAELSDAEATNQENAMKIDFQELLKSSIENPDQTEADINNQFKAYNDELTKVTTSTVRK